MDLQFALSDSEARPIRATIVVFQHGDRFIAYDDATRIGLLPGDDVTPLLQSRTLLLDTYALAPVIAALGTDISQVLIVADVEAEVDSVSLKQVQHLVLPMTFARRMTGESEPAAIVDALWNDQRSTVVITDGADGVWFRDAGSASCRHQPSFEVPVVDTTGCGDVFHGAYAVALARGFDALGARPVCCSRGSDLRDRPWWPRTFTHRGGHSRTHLHWASLKRLHELLLRGAAQICLAYSYEGVLSRRSCSVSGKPPMPRQARLLTSCLASSSVIAEVPPEIQ